VHIDAADGSEDVAEAIRATAADTEDAIRDMQDEAVTRRALDLLNSRRKDPYEAATAALREDTQQWWADTLARDPAELEEDEEPATADAEGLRRFLEDEVLPWFEARAKSARPRPRRWPRFVILSRFRSFTRGYIMAAHALNTNDRLENNVRTYN